MKHNNKEIDKWLADTVPGWCEMDFNTFGDTVSWFAYDPLIAKSWNKRLLKLIDLCEEKKLDYKEIAKLLTTPSEIRGIFGMELWASNFTNITKQERLKIFKFFNSVLKSICLEDTYARSKNIIHSEKEVNDYIKKLKKANINSAKKLGRLVNACYHLSHSLYSDMHPSISYDNYGSYDVSKKFGKNSIFVIKEFNNLNSEGIFNGLEKLPYNEIRIICIYKNVSMAVDSVSHVVFKGDLIKNLKYYYIEADNKVISINEIDKFCDKLEKLAIKVFQRFQRLNFEDRKKKFFIQKAYTYKFLCERIGLDWKPSKEILSEAKEKDLFSIEWPENKNKIKNLVRKMLDPRIKMNI